MYYLTYVLKSEVDDQLYIGWTNSLKKRLKEHNSGNVEATTYRKPFTLIYFEGCLSRKRVIEREKQLKTGFGRAYLKRRI